MSNSMSEQELSDRLAQLPREISPARDPWPEISAGIGQPGKAAWHKRSARSRWIQAIAACAVIALVAGLLFGPQWSQSPVSGQAREQMAADHDVGQSGFSGLLAASEREYLAAFREFMPLGHSRASLPALTVENIELSWAELVNTETALAAALEEHPNDPFLNDRMLELRARQLGFLKQLATLDSSNRRMTI